MDKLAKNIVNFCSTVAPYSYVLVIVTALVVGIMFSLPSDKLHEKAKSYGGWAIFGSIVISGCVTIGKWVGNIWSF